VAHIKNKSFHTKNIRTFQSDITIDKDKLASIKMGISTLQNDQFISNRIINFIVIILTIASILIGLMLIIIKIILLDKIKFISESTNNIRLENLNENITLHTNDELQDLNENINNMKQRLFYEINQNHEKDHLIIKQTKLAAMGEMTDAIAHQWKQPLSMINSYSSMLRLQAEIGNEITNADIIQVDTKIKNTVRHLIETMDSFRQFFRPNVQKSNENLKELIESVLVLCKDTLIKNNITTEFTKVNDIHYNLIPTEFKHVFINLINNTIDAFIENDINDRKITFEIFQTNDNIIITFLDNAGGIPSHVIDKIFEANVTSKPEGKGTGIGLYMSKQIIDKINGTIEASNQTYQYEGNEYTGAQFVITLPCKISSSDIHEL
jgi:two-component system C4-dicarboxylate transport sensor histidine kinase DctB